MGFLCSKIWHSPSQRHFETTIRSRTFPQLRSQLPFQNRPKDLTPSLHSECVNASIPCSILLLTRPMWYYNLYCMIIYMWVCLQPPFEVTNHSEHLWANPKATCPLPPTENPWQNKVGGTPHASGTPLGIGSQTSHCYHQPVALNPCERSASLLLARSGAETLGVLRTRSCASYSLRIIIPW